MYDSLLKKTVSDDYYYLFWKLKSITSEQDAAYIFNEIGKKLISNLKYTTFEINVGNERNSKKIIIKMQED